jgi:ribosome-binding protein aMBF1 (putative translation factor)
MDVDTSQNCDSATAECGDATIFFSIMPKLSSTSRDAVQFGTILRRLRLARGWSIVIAARRSGMNPNYLGSLEKGGNMPSVDTLLEMADLYGVWAADIVREVEEARRAERAQRAAQAGGAVVDGS